MKNKYTHVQQDDSHENAIVRRDFIFVITLNLILLAAMFGLFFWNQSTGALDSFFRDVIKF
jgi:hypothetical protein